MFVHTIPIHCEVKILILYLNIKSTAFIKLTLMLTAIIFRVSLCSMHASNCVLQSIACIKLAQSYQSCIHTYIHVSTDGVELILLATLLVSKYLKKKKGQTRILASYWFAILVGDTGDLVGRLPVLLGRCCRGQVGA